MSADGQSATTSDRQADVNAPEPTLYQIGTVAERVGLSLRTIRHWDEVGIVVPSGHSPGGFRLYTDDDIDRLGRVKAMKPLGFSLDETRSLLAGSDRLRAGSSLGAPALATLHDRVARAELRCEELQRQLDEARSATTTLANELRLADRRHQSDCVSGTR